jgi:hypothetical protein
VSVRYGAVSLVEVGPLLKDGELLLVNGKTEHVGHGVVPGILGWGVDPIPDAGNAISAACLNLPYVAEDYCAGAIKDLPLALCDLANQGWKFGLVPLNDGRTAKKSQDPRRGAKAHKHETQAPVFVGMGDGLAAGSTPVNICALVGCKHGEVRIGKSLGGYIYVSAVGGS